MRVKPARVRAASWSGRAGDAQAGEDAEGEVEAADEERAGSPGAGGNAEVGDEPEGVGGEVGCDAGGEGFELGLGEAVEEEVGDDEVVGDCGWVAAKARASVWWVRRRAWAGAAAGSRSWSMAALVSTASAWRCGFWRRRWARKRPSPSPRTRARVRDVAESGRKWSAAALRGRDPG